MRFENFLSVYKSKSKYGKKLYVITWKCVCHFECKWQSVGVTVNASTKYECNFQRKWESVDVTFNVTNKYGCHFECEWQSVGATFNVSDKLWVSLWM